VCHYRADCVLFVVSVNLGDEEDPQVDGALIALEVPPDTLDIEAGNFAHPLVEIDESRRTIDVSERSCETVRSVWFLMDWTETS